VASRRGSRRNPSLSAAAAGRQFARVGHEPRPWLNAQYLDRPLPYTQQTSIGLQRQLAHGWIVEAAYSGNFTRRLPVNASINVLPVNQLGQANTYYTTRIPNPMAGLLPDNPAKNASTIPRQDLLLPFPQYTGSPSRLFRSDDKLPQHAVDCQQTLLPRLHVPGGLHDLQSARGGVFLNDQDFNLATRSRQSWSSASSNMMSPETGDSWHLGTAVRTRQGYGSGIIQC